MLGKDIIKELKNKVSPEEYEKITNAIKYNDFESKDNLVVFNVANVFLCNWIKQKYLNLLISIAENKINENAVIKIEIQKQGQNNKIKKSSTKEIIKQNKLFINDTFTFNNFVVGECNEICYKTANVVAKNPGRAFNPVLIYGGTGLGKTHLLNAIANEALEYNPKTKIIYLTAEMFLNDYIQKLDSNGAMNDFRKTYRNCDFLLIDDIQFFGGKEQTQEEFFHTFEELIKNKKQIVMTSDKPPRDIAGLQERLKSRFEGGMNAKISSPEIETKVKIIIDKCKLNKISIKQSIIEYLAKNIGDNIRQIEGVITKLQAQSSILDIEITMSMAENAIKDISIENKHITLEKILDEVARIINIRPSEIKSKSRKKDISKARKIIIYLARKNTTSTTASISSFLNLKDHSSVSKQLKNIVKEMQKDKELSNKIEEIQESIKRS